jgi:spermidine synthase
MRRNAVQNLRVLMLKVTERKSRFGTITVLQTKKTGSLIYSQGDYFQSEADGNGTSLIPYIHGFYGLLSQARSENVLMIGCGGGTLATMLAKSGCKVTVVDINPHAFLLARQYFSLPASVVCRVADGCHFLLSEGQIFDAVILDAFAGDRIPEHLRSLAFFRLVRARLSPAGVIFANVHVRNDTDGAADRVATEMSHVWDDVRLLDLKGQTNRNAIVMAGQVSDLAKPALTMRPDMSADEIVAELDAMQFRPWHAHS